MASMKTVVCPCCSASYERTLKQLNVVIKRSGQWRCSKCATTQRNKMFSSPIGATRVHNRNGYVQEKTAEGWRRQHIVRMEEHIGRKLSKDEVVHHINGCKTDNRIENLQLMTHKEHTVLHHTGAVRSEATRKNISIGRKHFNQPQHQQE